LFEKDSIDTILRTNAELTHPNKSGYHPTN